MDQNQQQQDKDIKERMSGMMAEDRFAISNLVENDNQGQQGSEMVTVVSDITYDYWMSLK